MKITTHASVQIPRSPEDVFDMAASVDGLPAIMRAAPPIPGVVRVEMLEGATPAPGATRRVYLTDGGTMDEYLLELARPRRHRYRWVHPPAAPFSLLVRGAEADWRFRADGDGTRVDWYYRFALTSPLAVPLGAPAVLLFRRWMRRTLAELRRALA